jgi:hypothetical protein
MADSQALEQLTTRIAGELGQASATYLAVRLSEAGRPAAKVVALFEELEEASQKAARAAVEALPELDRRAGLSDIEAWLDLGVALAGSSGATALKFFKDSPLILGVIEDSRARGAVLSTGLEFADRDPNAALEYLKTAPRLLDVVSFAELGAWLDVAVDLIQSDVVVGLEFIRQIPSIAPVLPIGDVRTWLAFGLKLITPNAIGKPDYLATMEFLRRSPAILADIETLAFRVKAVSVGALLAQHSPDAGIAWLAESPRLLRALPNVEWRTKVLQYGALLGERHPAAALDYLRRSPEVVGLLGDKPQSASRFDEWFKAGMEVGAYSSEGVCAYFAMESQRALASVEEAISGVPLRRVARRVKLFVEGLCGGAVAITALPDSGASVSARAKVSADGRTIMLPAMLRQYAEAERNERLYLIMAAHEAGHLEFGTYRVSPAALVDVAEVARRRYGHAPCGVLHSMADLFNLYPHPRLMQDLWTVLEDARVEFLLREAYPGLRRDLAQLAAEAVTPRDPSHGLTVKELLVDCLLRLSTGEAESTAVPRAVQDEARELWRLCLPLFSATSTAGATVRVAHRVYVRMEELLAPRAEMLRADPNRHESSELGVGPSASEETGAPYRPVTNWVYRGEMNPEFIARDPGEAEDEPVQLGGTASGGGGSKERTSVGRGRTEEQKDSAGGDVLGGGRSLPVAVEELLTVDVEARVVADDMSAGARAVHYPEWDYVIQDYRVNWSRVVERPVEEGADDCVTAALTAHRSRIRALRRFFEGLRPPAFRRAAGQTDGEELDLDALVRRAAEQHAGFEGGDRVYIRREKKERDVAVAFLVDVSGSTGRQLEGGRRVIDVEKESLVLLCEALESVGDQYGLFAYSGQGRASVEFLTIKDFDERLGSATAHRLGGLAPRRQNRDGAAIRHAVAKLKAREARTRLLVLLSDGRPLDGDYKDEYSLQDTKAALQEARRLGVIPFCVTIDREADGYLRRMYGDVQYTVIDRVEALPTKLPRIYQSLTS